MIYYPVASTTNNTTDENTSNPNPNELQSITASTNLASTSSNANSVTSNVVSTASLTSSNVAASSSTIQPSTAGARSTGVGVSATPAANATASNMWDTDALDNDDFDSDQLDEDESYSWASGITDNQDGNGNGNSSNPGDCNSSTANWRDWNMNSNLNNPSGLSDLTSLMTRNSNQSFAPNNSYFNRLIYKNTQLMNSTTTNNPNTNSGLSLNLATGSSNNQRSSTRAKTIDRLVDLCTKFIATNLPFEAVESFHQPVPEYLQLKITQASFPDSIENIRLYSCLANGNVDEYLKGEQLYLSKCVRKVIQIGFHLSAQISLSSTSNNAVLSSNVNSSNANNVSSSNAIATGASNRHLIPNQNNTSNNTTNNASSANSSMTNVAIVCDRKRIVSCNCTCAKQSILWCSHIVAVCLYRILDASNVEYRAPVSESLSKLERDQLQKFAQYLISELPQQILPTAQRLLDELLKGNEAAINLHCGAPDPTAGASHSDISVWCLDEFILQENVRKTLIKFIMPTPNVVSDVECLEHASSATAAEYTNLLRPLRGREPEAMWNLVSIIREMFRRRDKNSIPLLRIITNECLAIDQIIQLWFLVKASQLFYDKVLFSNVSNSTPNYRQNGGNNNNNNPSSANTMHFVSHHNTNNNTNTSNLYANLSSPIHQACANLMDELVSLWRIVCLNPNEEAECKKAHKNQLITWNREIVERLSKFYNSILSSHQTTNHTANWNVNASSNVNFEKMLKRLDIDLFTAFLPALIACDESVWKEFDLNSPMLFKQQCASFMQLMNQKPTSNVTLPSNTSFEQQVSSSESKQPTTANSKASLVSSSSSSSTSSSDDFLTNLSTFDYELAKQIFKTNETSKVDTDLFKSKFKQTVNNYQIDDLEMLFARCEALHAHGYHQQSCWLAQCLADKMLYETQSELLGTGNGSCGGASNSSNSSTSLSTSNNPPESSQADIKPTCSSSSSTSLFSNNKNLKVKCLNNFTTTVLWRSTLLCQILSECSQRFQQNALTNDFLLFNANKLNLNELAFRVGILGLETQRAPAISKALEIKLINQEQELVNLLKRLHIGKYELNLLKDRAVRLRDFNPNKANTCAQSSIKQQQRTLPILMASFIFEILNSINGGEEQQLAFDCAVNVLSMKANISESQHPLLCEGIRRQKGTLALTLLVTFKDDEQRLIRILEKLLDRNVHKLFKQNYNPFNPNFKKIQQQQLNEFNDLGLEQIAPNVCTKKVTEHTVKASNLDSLSSGWEESENESSNQDSALLETKYRCLSLKESNTSSDNSPTRHTRFKTHNRSALNATSSTKKAEDSGDESSSSADNKPVICASSTEPADSSTSQSRGKLNYFLAGSSATTATTNNSSKVNQPSEALAHFMLEFAKTVLNKAGGSISTSMFLNNQAHQAGNGPHRNLHICSFLISLYALGLHNCVQPSWSSRTYSSHVTWINSQAVEIGFPAICFLIDCWQGHFTPSECASLADRASRSRDTMTVKAAAELALSSLRYANYMNLNEIQRALIQCKEQSNEMLQRACILVEHAVKDATNASLLEILFTVARRWEELFIDSTKQNASNQPNPALLPACIQPQFNMDFFSQAANIIPFDAYRQFNNQSGSALNSPANNANMANVSQATANLVANANLPPLIAPVPVQPSNSNSPINVLYYQANFNPYHFLNYQQQQFQNFQQNFLRQQQQLQQQQQQQQQTPAIEKIDSTTLKPLTNAFRVGMMGFEALPRRVDGSHQIKYRQSPTYADDIKWLLEVAIKLDTYMKTNTNLQQFCQISAAVLQNPILIQELLFRCAEHLSNYNPTQYSFALCSPLLNVLVQRCLTLYFRCCMSKLHHLTQNEHEDFINMLLKAREIFYSSQNIACFNDLIQNLRRSNKCKKDIWNKICNALNNSNNNLN